MIKSVKLNPLKSELDAILNLDSFLKPRKKTKNVILSIVTKTIPDFENKMLEVQSLFKELRRKKLNLETVA